MRTKDIELANISRFRGELMGAAMLFIILFHVGLPRTDLFFGLRRCGNIGVDIFLFLSGIGLWFSWVKQPSTWSFYRRRLLRILPAWLIMASLYYIPRFNPQTGSIIDLIGNITINWNFWLHDELTFWYIPAIMMLYLWAPPYMKLITKHPIYRWSVVLMVLWCVMVQWIIPVHHAVGHLEIFWSRVPIFFLGINFGEMVRRELNEVKYTVRRNICMEAGAKLNKHWTKVNYNDIEDLDLPYETLASLKAMFGTTYWADLDDYETYVDGTIQANNSPFDIPTDKYNTIEGLLIHEMIMNESKLTDKQLHSMADMYSLNYTDLLHAVPRAERDLYMQLQDRLDILSIFE